MSVTKNFEIINLFIENNLFPNLLRTIYHLKDNAERFGYKLTVTRVGTMRNRHVRLIFNIPLAFLYAGPFPWGHEDIDRINYYLNPAETFALGNVRSSKMRVPVTGFVIWDVPVGFTRDTENQIMGSWFLQHRKYTVISAPFDLPGAAQRNIYQYLGMYPNNYYFDKWVQENNPTDQQIVDPYQIYLDSRLSY